MSPTCVANACEVWIQSCSTDAVSSRAADNNYSNLLWVQRVVEPPVPADEFESAPTVPVVDATWTRYTNEAIGAGRSGDLEKSVQLWLAALQISASDDRKVAFATDNLLFVLMAVGKFEQAEVHGKRALELIRRCYGKEDIRALNCMNNLGGAYYALQRYKQAELLGLQVLTEFNKIYRKDHLSVGIASKNLAMAYHAQGTLGLAEILYERAISILKPRFGAAHSQVSTLMKNHANVLDQMGSSYECEQIRTELKNAVVCQLFDANSPERISA